MGVVPKWKLYSSCDTTTDETVINGNNQYQGDQSQPSTSANEAQMPLLVAQDVSRRSANSSPEVMFENLVSSKRQNRMDAGVTPLKVFLESGISMWCYCPDWLPCYNFFCASAPGSKK